MRSAPLAGQIYYDGGLANQGRALVFHGSAGGLGAAPDWTAVSGQISAAFGGSVASAGDVNGDGYDDVLVGAYQYEDGEQGEGRAYLYSGSAAGLSLAPSWTAESNHAGAGFGSHVASAGDVNGDGWDDASAAVFGGAQKIENGIGVERWIRRRGRAARTDPDASLRA